MMQKLLAALLGVAAARPAVREIRNLQEYDKLIQHHKSETGLPVVVDFYSDSCGPCRMIAPAFKKLAKEMKDRAVFAKVNVALARDVASRMRVSSMPTFHFYEDGVKRHEFSGAGEYQLRQLAERVASDAQAKNVRLSSDSLQAFYDEHDPSKKDIGKILSKCASLAKGKECVGGAARELAKKLRQKFGAAPALSTRFGAAKAPPPKVTRSRSLDAASTDELLAELAKRADDDDLAFAAANAADEARMELEEDEEEDEGELPLYRPHGQFAERVVIVGAGPGGLSAAVYASRAGLAPVVVAPDGGGQLLGKGVTVENYPGVQGDTGPGLVKKMRQHAADCGAVFYAHKSYEVDLSQRPFVVRTPEANISAHALIIATGADSRWLGVEGEATYRGGGVSSCATCDGFLFRDLDVAVIGGGDTAMEDALVLARTSKSVTVVHRRDAFRASHEMAKRVLEHPKITIRWNATVEAFRGEEVRDDAGSRSMLTGVTLRDTATGEADALAVKAAFVAIGHDPNTRLFGGLLKTNGQGYLELRGGRFATEVSVAGVFAAGDVADPIYRQAITSAGSGAMAALDAERFLSEKGIQDESERFADDLMAELMADMGSSDAYNAYSEPVDLTSANARAEL